MIPFDLESGVPFIDSEVGYCVDGFEIDDQGQVYFMAGLESPILACFDGVKKVWRRSYTQFKGSQIHSYQGVLYVFDIWPYVNNLFWINPYDGEIVKSLRNVVQNRVNNHYYLDSLLILNVYNLDDEISPYSERHSVTLDLTGSLVGFTDSLNYLPKQELEDYSDYLGKWKEYYVYWSWIDTLKITIRDLEGNTLQLKEINTNIFTNILYYNFPLDHVELEGDKIYHLSKKEDQAVITIFSLKKLFPGL